MATRSGLIYKKDQSVSMTYVHWDGDILLEALEALKEEELPFVMGQYWSSISIPVENQHENQQILLISSQILLTPLKEFHPGLFWEKDPTSFRKELIDLAIENLPGDLEYIYIFQEGTWEQIKL